MIQKKLPLLPCLLLASMSLSNPASASKLSYEPITPCRAVNTREIIPADSLKASVPRIFKAYGGDLSDQGGQPGGCINPREINNKLPVAVAANIVAVGATATGNGNLVLYPGDVAIAPGTSTVNYKVGTNISNSTIISLAKTADNNFNVQSNFSDVHVVIDILGYFYETSLNHVITVSHDTDGFGGGDFSEPATALASIQDSSDVNRYLIKIGPGVYTLDAPLQMKEYVDIQGAGENMTHLIRTGGSVSATADATASAIVAANHSTLRDLTVESRGDNDTFAVGIYNDSITAMKISHVTAKAGGATSENDAVLTVNGAAPVINNSTLWGVGSRAYGLLATNNSKPMVINSMLRSDPNDFISLGLLSLSDTAAKIVNSQIFGGVGGVVDNDGSGTECRGTYDENLVEVVC